MEKEERRLKADLNYLQMTRNRGNQKWLSMYKRVSKNIEDLGLSAPSSPCREKDGNHE